MTETATVPTDKSASSQSKIYSIGTLSYTQPQLFILFFWLIWNDFSITLLEQINSLNVVLFKDNGATNTQISVINSFSGIAVMLINPWCSTWSDRFRSKHGRRRPFLLVSTPIFAILLMAIPFMPDLYRQLCQNSFVSWTLSHVPISGPVLFVAAAVTVSSLFNAVVTAIFSYLYWDVVPDSLMGRFQSMGKLATTIAGLVWSFFIFGLADHHIKGVYIGTASFCLIVYLISVWRIREGEYPPPEQHKAGAYQAVRSYVVDCFSSSYYIWIFVAHLAFQTANLGNNFQFFYLRYDLGLSLATIGWTQGWSKVVTAGFGLLCGFAVGSLTDRLKPVRLMAPTFIILAITNIGGYFFVHDKWSYLWFFCLNNIAGFVFSIVIGAFTVEVFPREKLGQFCSAQFMFYQCALVFLSPLCGAFFDATKNNRIGFLWSTTFMILAAVFSVKVHLNWKRREALVCTPENQLRSTSLE